MPPKASGRGRKKVVQEKAVEKSIETYFSPSKKISDQTLENEKILSEKAVTENNVQNGEIVKQVRKQLRKKGRFETIETEEILNEKVETKDDNKNEEIVEPITKQGRKKGKLNAVSNISDNADPVVSNSLPIDDLVSNSLPTDDVTVSRKRGKKKLQKDVNETTESNLKDDVKDPVLVNGDGLNTLNIEKQVGSTEEIEDKSEPNEVKTKGTAKRGRKKITAPITDETVVIQKSVDSQTDVKNNSSDPDKLGDKTVSSKPTSKVTKSGAIQVESDKNKETKAKESKKEEEEVNTVPVKGGRKRKNANAVPQKKETKRNKAAEKKVSDIENVDENRFLKVSLKRSKSIDELVSENDKIAEKSKDSKKAATKGKRAKAGDAGDSGKDAVPAKKLKEETKSKGQSKKDKMPDVTVLDFSNTSTSPNGKAWNLKLASWNVNGIRAWLEKDGLIYLKHECPDIMCVQETKCSEDKLPTEVNVEGYHSYWLAGDKDGYSGVGLLSKKKPLSVKYGIDNKEHDAEGRVITAEYEDFFLISAYVPNAGRGLVRLDYRMQWDKDFCSYIKSLDESKPVILCGDLNVAHEEIDLANPKTNKKNAGFTKEEREGFTTLLSEGFIDTFRHLYPDQKAAYTFWTYMMNARAKNVGWRLDYFVVSKRFVDNLCDSVMRKDVFGSDHCPIVLFISV